MRGWVYVIRNKAIPNLLKIGFSTKDPIMRARDFNGTGVPFDFEVLFDALVDSPREVEQSVHRSLTHCKENKEWFRCDLDDAIRQIRICAGVIYKEQFHSVLSNNQKSSRVVFQGAARLERTDFSSDSQEIAIGTLKAKAVLRLLKNRIDETMLLEIDGKLLKSLRITSYQIEDLIHRTVVDFEEFDVLHEELQKICSFLDPCDDELAWTLLSTATIICGGILVEEFEVTDSIQSFLDYAEVLKLKILNQNIAPVVEKINNESPTCEVQKTKEIQQKRPNKESKCPGCQYIFQPAEVTELVDIWMRCPKCRQMMNID